MNKGITSILSAAVGAAVAVVFTKNNEEKKIQKARGYADKHLALFLMMNEWVKVKQKGKNLSTYFEKKGYKKIAIYGLSYAGETLISELKDTGIEIAYAIDKNASGMYLDDLDIYSMDEELGKVDVIVVTAITFFESIENELSSKVEYPIVSLEDVLYEV